MGTLLCFHAHPDDESMSTAGLMAKAAAAGHRVVLVTATRGELGEIVPDVLAEGEQLALRRSAELYESARLLGVARVEVLGYVDSGMMGTPGNDAPWSFWQADVEIAAQRLATILRQERPDALTIYDDHGGYGHPDHIQVHRVGRRAAEIAGVRQVYQATMNRDHILRLAARRAELGVPKLPGDRGESDGTASDDAVTDGTASEGAVTDDPSFGSPESIITHVAEVGDFADLKRRSLRAHRSQVADDFFLLQLPEQAYRAAMGREWFIGPGEPAVTGSLAAELFSPYDPSTDSE